jgi:GntR family transcriptional repressor for pyruvate dehydrogenase complex
VPQTEQLFQRVVQTRISDKVVEQMLALIDSLRLKPGDRLPGEREMRDQLSVSRSALREAIRIMESQGVLDVRPGLGTFVSSRPTLARLPSRLATWLAENKGQVIELLEVRGALEPLAAALAARRASADQIAGMQQVLAQTEADAARGNLEGIVEGDIQFHKLISESGGNALLIELNDNINGSLLESRYAYYSLPTRVEASSQGHRQVMAAIAAHDPDGAALAMRAHIESSINYYAVLDFGLDSAPSDSGH